MAKEGGYKISYSYPGGYNNLDPEYGSIFTGYRTDVGSLGVTTDVRVANILKEFSDKVATGQKTIEISAVMPEVFDSIPKQQLEEVRQLSKLTGVDATMHGPLVEASGLSKEGFTEGNREAAERQMLQAMEKAHTISPEGNIPVTFHSSAMLPATEYAMRDGKEEVERIYAIEKESGQIMPVKKEEKFYPTIEEGEVQHKVHTPHEQIDIINNTKWIDSLTEMVLPLERTNQVINEVYPIAQTITKELQKNPESIKYLSESDREVMMRYQGAYEQLSNTHTHLVALFNKAYKYSEVEGAKEKLKEVAKEFENKLSSKGGSDARVLSSALLELRNNLTPFKPQLFQDLDGYSIDKSSETFGNVAFESYKKFKENAPIISVENPPAGMNAFSRAKDLKNIVEKSRKQFVERASQSVSKGGLGMSASTAEKEAEKLIGVTWDVGHINQLKKYGFTDEDLAEESAKIAPYLKHVHLSDNFGMENTELPMGTGNVPLKAMMEKLGKKGKEAKKIVEAGNWWQHFKTSPMQMSYEAMGSPLYSMKMSPYWNQPLGSDANYFSGYGTTLPQINYETFGGGFSQLPAELGGQRPGQRGSRIGGTPME